MRWELARQAARRCRWWGHSRATPFPEAMPMRENDFRDWRDLSCVDAVIAEIPERFVRDRHDTAAVERVPSLPIGEDYDCLVRFVVHVSDAPLVVDVQEINVGFGVRIGFHAFTSAEYSAYRPRIVAS